jgi:hypothetical protein
MTTGTMTPILFQKAWIADLKTRTSLVALSSNFPLEIREAEWQGTDFTYPNIRVSLDFMPTQCGPQDADIYLEVFSDQKSSELATIISSKLVELYHNKPFTSNGIHFSTVIVRKVTHPDRSIYAWVSKVHIFCQGI